MPEQTENTSNQTQDQNPGATGDNTTPKDTGAAGATGHAAAPESPGTSPTSAGTGTPAQGGQGAGASASNQKPGVSPEDLDARLARIDAVLRKTQPNTGKDAPAATTTPVNTAPDPLALLKEGKRAEAIVALLGEQADEDVLLELAPLLDGKIRKELTVEELVDAKLAARDATTQKQKDEDAKKAAEAEEAEGQRQLQEYLVRGAQAQQAGIAAGKYPFIEDYGVDPARFQELLFKHIDEKKEIPTPDALLDQIESEHKDRWSKSRFAPRSEEVDEDEQIRRSFAAHRDAQPPAVYTPRPDEDEDPGRALIRKYDFEQRNKRDWR